MRFCGEDEHLLVFSAKCKFLLELTCTISHNYSKNLIKVIVTAVYILYSYIAAFLRILIIINMYNLWAAAVAKELTCLC